MIRFENLEDASFPSIHACFRTAFSDYAVNMDRVTEAAFARRAAKNDWDPRLSAGAWDGNQLVAITLVGVDVIAGEKRAYDICTGIIPAYRGQGLAGRMMSHLLPDLREAGIAAFQLEVLQDNAAAIKAYRRVGFSASRALLSFEGTVQPVPGRRSEFAVRPIDLQALLGLSNQLAFDPSYEQRDRAIECLGDELVMLGAHNDGVLAAAIGFDPKTNWLMRLVTHREYRRQGAARALIHGLAGRLDPTTPVRAINIDADDVASLGLMAACGLEATVSQWEMRLAL